LGEHIRSAPAPWASARQHTGDDHCDELGRRLLEEAVEQAAARYRAGHPVPVTVRVPPRLLADRDTAEQRLEGLLAGFGLPLGALFLEVSDSDPQVPLEVLERSVVALRRLGVRFVLSGPGGGRGALHALRRLPVDVLRIDRGLVEGITESARCQKITAGLLRIAADLGLQTVAEGVDQPEQAGLLRVMGCTYGQGAAFSGPLDEHRLRRALTRGAYQMPLVPDQRDSSRDAVLTSSFSQVRVGGVMTSGTVGHHLVRSNNETPVPPA
jgi:EAL domain-containing protein (putative c-di-GMP-specific phosphodiesterase class I)